MIGIGITYLFLIIICPLIYQYLLQIINQKNHDDRIVSLHQNIFFFIQGFISLLSIKYLLIYHFFIEMLVSLVNVFIISKYYFRDNPIRMTEKSKIIQIISFLLMPLFVMNFIRNHFDTYLIGYFIFNISNVSLLLCEIIMISTIYFYQFWNSNHFGTKMILFLISLKLIFS